MKYDYDVVMIGSGHATWHGVLLLVQAGKKVALVDQDVTGGTCTNYGCDAKFLLDSPFEFLDGLARYEAAGIAKRGEISWPKLMAYKQAETSPYPKMLEKMFEASQIELLNGHGQLVDEHTIAVDDQQVTAEYIVLGTGQHANKLNVPGQEFTHDSRDFLDLVDLPDRFVMIGAGIISLEFATMMAALGKHVDIVEYGDRALKAYPAAYAQAVVDKLTKEGVKFHFNEAVTGITNEDDAYQVTTASGLSLATDYILDATGRSANTANLGLETVGVAFNRGGIAVDDHLRTTVPNIFASGDVIDKTIPRLTPTASFESNYIASVILGNDAPIKYPVVPNLVFTFPRIAQVGVTPDIAKAHPETFIVKEVPLGQQLGFQNKLEASQATYILNQEHQLVGAALLGTEAGEWINLLTLIINQGLTVNDLNQMIFAFPGTTDGLLNSLKQAMM